MKLSSESSQRLKVLRFPLILGVVFLHTRPKEAAIADAATGSFAEINTFIQVFISRGLATTAVPLFFIISGYFFFLNCTWSKDTYLSKLKSRGKSLLVPYLFWTICIFSLSAIIQSLLNKVDIPSSPVNIINSILGITHVPCAYQFWFIRDLILLAILSPLIHLAHKTIPFTFLILSAVFWYSDISGYHILSCSAIFFFYLGSLIAIKQIDLFHLDRFAGYSYFLYFGLLTLNSLFIHSQYLHKLNLLIGLLALLSCTKHLYRSIPVRKSLSHLAGSSFFLFAIHEPLLSYAWQASQLIPLPATGLSSMIRYFIIPTTVVILVVLLYEVLNEITPRFLSIITGGRR